MVTFNEPRSKDVTMDAAEQCTVVARIYHDGRGSRGDMRQMGKQGWKVVSVQEQRWPVSLDRIRAEAIGALTRQSTSDLVVFYQRCGYPVESRAKRIVMRFRGEPKHQA